MDDNSEHGYIVISQEEPMDSESTITEELLVQQTDEISDADNEDAQTSTDTVDSADEDKSAERGATQQISDETIQEDTLDSHMSQHKDNAKFIPVRRSTRERRQADWLRSREFDMR